MAESLVVTMATSISTNKATHARLERNPRVSRHPLTNSTPDTKYVITRGNGTLASTNVSYIVCALPATNNLLAPEMAKNSPSETRTSRMAYCSRSLLPCSTNWTNRFQSTSCPSFGGCTATIPRIDRPILLVTERELSRGRLCVHPFDPLSARCGSYEWIRKVLRFPGNLVVPELHDAHGVGRLAVICQDEFGDPKITAANDSPDSKPLLAGLTSALVLYVAPTARSLAR